MTLCPSCEVVGISDKYELKLSPSTDTISARNVVPAQPSLALVPKL